MRLFALAFLSFLLFTSSGQAEERRGDFDPNGQVADCEVASVVVQVAGEAGVSLREAWRALDLQGVCFELLLSGVHGLGATSTSNSYGPYHVPGGLDSHLGLVAIVGAPGPISSAGSLGPDVTPSGLGPNLTPSG